MYLKYSLALTALIAGSAAGCEFTSCVGDVLTPDMTHQQRKFEAGESICNGVHSFGFTTSGNLVLCSNGVEGWSAPDVPPGSWGAMQAGGKFVVYGPDESVIFDSGAAGGTGSIMQLSPDGVVSIVSGAGETIFEVKSTVSTGDAGTVPSSTTPVAVGGGGSVSADIDGLPDEDLEPVTEDLEHVTEDLEPVTEDLEEIKEDGKGGGKGEDGKGGGKGDKEEEGEKGGKGGKGDKDEKSNKTRGLRRRKKAHK